MWVAEGVVGDNNVSCMGASRRRRVSDLDVTPLAGPQAAPGAVPAKLEIGKGGIQNHVVECDYPFAAIPYCNDQ